MKFKII